MKCHWLLGCGFVLLLFQSRAVLVGEDFSTIARKNVFRLSPPKSGPKPEELKPELPQLTLQGVTTILDSRQALLKIQSKAKLTATEVCCILGEGQERDGVQVLRIDMESGTVWLTNQGTGQMLVIRQ